MISFKDLKYGWIIHNKDIKKGKKSQFFWWDNHQGESSHMRFVRTTSLYCKYHLSFCGSILTAYLWCKDHLIFLGFIRTAYLYCKDHPSFCGFIRTAYLCWRTTFHFVIFKNRAVLLKWKGSPSNTNCQNMSFNSDHPILLHSVCMSVTFAHI